MPQAARTATAWVRPTTPAAARSAPATPEPQTCALMLAGLAAMGLFARRRQSGNA